MNTELLNDHRCGKCGKLLCKGIFIDGQIEVKCNRCGEISKIGVLQIDRSLASYVVIIDDKGTITNVSDSISDKLGYSIDELVGQNLTLIDPTLPPEIIVKFFGIRGDVIYRFDTFHQDNKGKKIPTAVLLKSYRPTKTEKYLLLFSEKIEKVPNNNLFKKNTLKFQDNYCDYYFDIDMNGDCEYMSSSVTKFFGFLPKDVLGKNYFEFLPVNERAKYVKLFKHFSKNGQSYRVSLVYKQFKSGKINKTEQYFTTRFNDSGVFTGYRVLGWVINNKARKLKT